MGALHVYLYMYALVGRAILINHYYYYHHHHHHHYYYHFLGFRYAIFLVRTKIEDGVWGGEWAERRDKKEQKNGDEKEEKTGGSS